MKKKIVIILATLMCISLCACGRAEGTSGTSTDSLFKTEKEIEITADNWQEYFEIEYKMGERTNNFDEIEYTEEIVCYVKLKDKYVDKLAEKKSFEIDFEFEMSTHFWDAEIDLGNGTFELIEEMDSCAGINSGESTYLMQTTITNVSLEQNITSTSIIEDHIIQYPQLVELNRVQGTLYIYE